MAFQFGAFQSTAFQVITDAVAAVRNDLGGGWHKGKRHSSIYDAIIEQLQREEGERKRLEAERRKEAKALEKAQAKAKAAKKPEAKAALAKQVDRSQQHMEELNRSIRLIDASLERLRIQRQQAMEQRRLAEIAQEEENIAALLLLAA